ncbi:lipoprotein insertase outer membrane protein LolB [Microbulbifer thermotolerans]|uniref:lipoprotein insertase outer membrane protein LolB n=1 Tax=Microbulbifer thermotolerans TaxID=252514 RepID=UPI002248C024|nr:lipoprotein insertase outer membrane protein LolB [Microbulbifer thermotolerans]MCX2794263.1 lipoprotein insertase outer membrane protein LolB [Microbulbifer thermotolerans]MCX2830024.1 lipoprotein insertase outer membrane protein LolB [Microbulbifer thermotolerans]MCX2834222.1 lipoprotein insertase outer membrane protein LolB [Microbulbifer thermotolerans]
MSGASAQLVLILTALLLGACAGQRPQPSQIPAPAASPAAQLQHWTIKGKLGVRSPNENGSANLTWQQQAASDYRIHLSGPLGAGSTVITGSPAGIRLQRGGDPPMEARNAEELTTQTLGWPLPVNEMFYWVRGLAAPGPASQQQRNAQGQLQSLQQAGWQLIFSDYQNRGAYVLPTRINASTQGAAGPVTVKLIIKEWLF